MQQPCSFRQNVLFAELYRVGVISAPMLGTAHIILYPGGIWSWLSPASPSCGLPLTVPLLSGSSGQGANRLPLLYPARPPGPAKCQALLQACSFPPSLKHPSLLWAISPPLSLLRPLLLAVTLYSTPIEPLYLQKQTISTMNWPQPPPCLALW